MNITLLRLAIGLLFLVPPAYAFWRLDRRLLRQSVKVLLRMALTLAVLALCLHYIFLWNSPWVNMLWVIASGAVAAAVYCRKRWLAVPVFVGTTVSAFVIGPLILWLTGTGRLFDAWMFIPVMSILQADGLFVARRALSTYVLNRKQHGSLDEYLRGNGATPFEAQQPFIARAVVRSFVPVLSQLLLVGVVFVPSLLVGLLMGGFPPLQSMGFLVLLTVGALCDTVSSALLTICLYVQLKK